MSSYYVGLMSGTSLDGVDGVLVDLVPAATLPLRVIAHVHVPFAESARREFLELSSSGPDELHRAALAGNVVARQYALVVEQLLDRARVDRREIRAIGAHGQTVRHRPGEFDGSGYTIQLSAPALLAELTGIDVVCDFRSRDVAAGGQGAPLVPAFHCATFSRLAPEVAVINIGGISNLTVLSANAVMSGFDCGPGNALMDYWCQRHTGARFDDQGAWAASGSVNSGLLDAMMREPYFSRPLPKSTGRDLFNPAWLEGKLRGFSKPIDPVHVQATLADLTAKACARDVLAFAPGARLLVVCGGGAHNRHLMARMATYLPSLSVRASDEFGLPVDQVEGCAFAWLAHAFLERQPASLPAVTGARSRHVLGALYPAA